MTSTLAFATVTAAIKTQLMSAVADLTVKDTFELPDAINPRECPLLYPEMRGGFISNVVIGYNATGLEGLRMGRLEYELRYSLAYKPVGEGRGLYTVIPDLMDMTKRIIDGALTKDVLGGTVGIIDFFLDSVSGPGIVMDPAGNEGPNKFGFYGFEYLFKVTEFIN